MLQWRAMGEGDVAGVQLVSEAVHPELPEREAVVAARLRLYPAGCHVLAGADGTIGGYMMSHPIRPFEPPVLDRIPDAIPPDATQYYIHDIALHPRLRGGGHARPIIEHLLAEAAAFDSTALISVYGTTPFWSKFGFSPSERDMSEALYAYGPGAVFMVRAPN